MHAIHFGPYQFLIPMENTFLEKLISFLHQECDKIRGEIIFEIVTLPFEQPANNQSQSG